MIPQHIYDAIIESPAGKLIDRLIAEEYAARGGNPENLLAEPTHGSIIDQLYETITTAQKKYRRDRVKDANKQRLSKYQSFVQTEPQTVQWSAIGDFTSWEPTGESDE